MAKIKYILSDLRYIFQSKEKKASLKHKKLTAKEKERVLNKVKEYLRVFKPYIIGVSFLDIGSGGFQTILQFIDGKRKVAVDPVIQYIPYNLNKNIEFKSSYAENLTFKSGSFDGVFITNALDHFGNPELALQETKRVLKKSGRVFIMVNVFEKSFGRDKLHPYTFTKGQVYDLLSKYFKPIKVLSCADTNTFYFIGKQK